MKTQDKKTKIGIVALSLFTITLSVGLIAKLTKKPASVPTKIDPQVDFYSGDSIYGKDYEKIVASIPEDAEYTITYDNADLNLVDQEKPTQPGNWTAKLKVSESDKYHEGIFTKDFNYQTTSYAKVSSFFKSSNDSWGGDSTGTSVNCSDKNIVFSQTADGLEASYKLTIDTDNDTSACLDSNYTMFDGTFKILFKTDLSDYGTFAFWLTGVESEQNTKDEITVELTKNKMIFGSAKGDPYITHDKSIDIEYADGYWHSLEIFYDHTTPEAKITMDGKVIHEFAADELPNVEYVMPHIGLLYPTNPTWTGVKTEKQVTANVANYEVYKVNGDAQ